VVRLVAILVARVLLDLKVLQVAIPEAEDREVLQVARDLLVVILGARDLLAAKEM
jgi:hypothetical protein